MGFIISIYKGDKIPIKFYKGVKYMDYQKAYALLVGVVSNTIDEINKSHILSPEIENALYMLRLGLTETEEMYISSGE